MRVALISHKFSPDIGGIESMSLLLAEGLQSAGHQVTVVTHSAPRLGATDSAAFKVVRQPSARELLRIHRDADVIFHNNIALRFAWPLAILRRPWVVAVHTWIRRSSTGRRAVRDSLKHLLLRRASVISVSNAIARHLDVKSAVIPNAYRDDVFYSDREAVPISSSLVFVGRLVWDKGVDLLLEALHELKSYGLEPNLELIGDGPERPALESQTHRLGLAHQVTFRGALSQPCIAQRLRRASILVVPSRWEEPFGVVALEGIASGCVVVGSDGGGLPDAIGNCGVTFRRNDARDLARQLRRLLETPRELDGLRADVARHLHRHRRSEMVRAYSATLEKAAHQTVPRGAEPS